MKYGKIDHAKTLTQTGIWKNFSQQRKRRKTGIRQQKNGQKERAIEKNIDISSHQGEKRKEKYLLRFVVFKRDLLNVFRC